MGKLEQYKREIIEALNNIARLTLLNNKAGRFDINKNAEELYRVLLLLFYGWELGKNANTIESNYEGVDLLFLGETGTKVAVQVTSENDSEKVHKSIEGFKNKALKDGYSELYVLMFTGKQEFPRADFEKSVNGTFKFDKTKHIIDHSDLCAKLKDAEFDYVKAIWEYLNKYGLISAYDTLDSDIDNLGIIGEIFEHIQSNKPKKASSDDKIKDSLTTDLGLKIKLNFPEDQRLAIDDLIRNVWDKKEVVRSFLEKQTADDEVSVNELAETIKNGFRTQKGSINSDARIEDVAILKNLAKTYLPESQIRNPAYIANAEALILYFFEFCFIGKKTKDNPQPSLFD